MYSCPFHHRASVEPGEGRSCEHRRACRVAHGRNAPGNAGFDYRSLDAMTIHRQQVSSNLKRKRDHCHAYRAEPLPLLKITLREEHLDDQSKAHEEQNRASPVVKSGQKLPHLRRSHVCYAFVGDRDGNIVLKGLHDADKKLQLPLNLRRRLPTKIRAAGVSVTKVTAKAYARGRIQCF